MRDSGSAIISVGNLDQLHRASLGDWASSVVHLELSAVIPSLSKAKILLIGDGLPAGPRSELIWGAREATPMLRIYVLSADMAERDDAADADASFELPRDSGRLEQAVSAALRGGKRRGWLADYAAALLGFGTLLVLWMSVTAVELMPPYLLPSPIAVVRALLTDSNRFLSDFALTAMEAGMGFALGNAAALALAVLLHPSRRIQSASLPTLTGIQALPIIALAPLFALWFGTGMVSKVAMASLVCFAPVLLNLLGAFSAVERDLVEMFRFHRASYASTLRHLLLPASAPALIAGLRASASLAVVGALVAEFTGSDAGLGYQLLTASYRLQTDRLFVAILLSGLLGMLFAAAPTLLGSLWLRRLPSDNPVLAQ